LSCDAVDYEHLFLENLGLIDRVVRAVARRHRLSPEQTEELSSSVRLKIVEREYEILRRFRHRSTLGTYLTVVVQRQFLDLRTAAWGKWRPCRRAQRLGPLAVLLDRLLTRDGLTFDQACEVLWINHAVKASRDELLAIRRQLRERSGRRLVGDVPLAAVAATAPSPDAEIDARRQVVHADRVAAALGAAVSGLAAEDRLLLKLRFTDRLTVSHISRLLGLDQKALYRRLERVMRVLRAELEAQGVRRDRVLAIVGHPAVDLAAVI
jgi:RNA polymerase sigma factor for flagellar operon FliA